MPARSGATGPECAVPAPGSWRSCGATCPPASRTGSRGGCRCGRRHACTASGRFRPQVPRRGSWGNGRGAASRGCSWPVSGGARGVVVHWGVRSSYAADATPRSTPPRRQEKSAPVSRRAPCSIRQGGGAALRRDPSARGRRLVLLRLRRLAQFLAQDLADVALRQLVAELDVARLLVAGQRLAAVGLDVLGGQGWVLLDH